MRSGPDAVGGAEGTGTHSWVGEMPFEPRAVVRLGIIGAGGRGRGLLRSFLLTGAVQVVAICDPDEPAALAAEALVREASDEPIARYGATDREVLAFLGRGDLDLVLIATSWDQHVPMAIAAMAAGLHAAVEVPPATTLQDCWRLVDTSEQTRRHCVILENDCYSEADLLVLNMIRDGVFGDLLHLEDAYLHDLRRLLFSDEGEGRWRRAPHTVRDGNLYPTHAMGPTSSMIGINRGDQFETLVSMSSAQRGLDLWRTRFLSQNDPKQNERYVCGDVNTSLLRTVGGVTVLIQHNVVSPLPRDSHKSLTGTKGAARGLHYPTSVFIDGMDEAAGFVPIDTFRDRYQHRLWREFGSRARDLGGHGGMDFIMAARLVECMRQGLPPDLDVYDAASWSAVGPLSEASVAGGSTPAEFPDFTRGRWETRRLNLT